jgi:hypothetical protein
LGTPLVDFFGAVAPFSAGAFATFRACFEGPTSFFAGACAALFAAEAPFFGTAFADAAFFAALVAFFARAPEPLPT